MFARFGRGNRSIHFIERIEPTTVFILLALFVVTTINFFWKNDQFWFDDLVHFVDARTKTLLGMMASRIDVHFAPLHQLASFLIFKFSTLNFGLALSVMTVLWICNIALIHGLLRRLSTDRIANIITLLFGVSPLWFHTLVWWSAAAHRLPYLLFQTSALFAYFNYREDKKGGHALICVLSQILAIGFFMKGILFPVVLIVFELCLAARYKNIFRAGLRLCAIMAVISALYIGWYFWFTPYSHEALGFGLAQSLSYAMLYTLGASGALLFLAVDQFWSYWFAGVFWITLACCRIYYCPVSALPIAALLVLVVLNFTMSIWGRGVLVASPITSLRYYSEVLVLIAVFAALALNPDQSSQIADKSLMRKKFASMLVLVLVVIYPMGSYFSNRHVFQMIYADRKLTRKFIINVQHTLADLNTQASPKVLQANFPLFVYGYLAARLPLEAVFGRLYPRIEWIPLSQAKSGLDVIQDDGSVAPLVLPSSEL